MGTWAYQGLELFPHEQPEDLLGRLANLETGLGRRGSFSAIGTFQARIVGANPPRYNPKGQPRRFLHVAWHNDSLYCWPVVYYIGQRDRRAILSSYTGVGFYARDIDRDGHPREPVLLACFTADAEDFPEPIVPTYPSGADWETLQRARQVRIAELAAGLREEGIPPERVAEAERLAVAGAIRFDTGWFLRDGTWMSRYLVQRDKELAMAVAQKALCTCTSRYPESLQLVMPSDNCVHFLLARLTERLTERALAR